MYNSTLIFSLIRQQMYDIRKDNENIANMVKQLSSNIEMDLTKLRNAYEEMNRQIIDLEKMKARLESYLKKLKDHSQWARSEDITLDESFEVQDENQKLGKNIIKTCKQFNEARMKSIHVIHHSIQKQNDDLKEHLR